MTEEYLSNSCSSECYFEYTMDKVDGDDGIEAPKLYFERDYTKETIPYTLFVVPQEWLERYSEYDRNDSSLPYDEIDLVYDVSGIECEPLTNHRSEEYNRAEIKNPMGCQSIASFYKGGCRINIASHSTTLAGVGVIKMLKNKKEVATFFFVVNFSFKTKIHYKLTYANSKLTATFKCKERPQNVRVRITWFEGRLPCLRNDMGSIVKEFDLDFAKKDTYSETIEISSIYPSNVVFSATIVDEDASKYYVLHCDANDTAKIVNAKLKDHPVVYICPYCHQKMDNRLFGNGRYKRGGVSCSFYSKRGPLPLILEGDNKKMKNCLYCAGDINDSGDFDFSFMRLLPKNFMEHDSFKIAFLGSKRAGKTTYISRFFDLSGDAGAQMDMTMIHNGLGKMGVNVTAAPVMQVDRHQDNMKYTISNAPWTNTDQYYNDRVINLVPPRYPQATTTGGGYKHPFIAEINKDVYVSFYDVAGEDSQNKQMISVLTGGENEYMGVFCIVSGTKDAKGNSAVFNQLRESKIHKDSPIAVIVTKFDTLKDFFDPSCHCTRTDYFDDTKVYQDSYIQHEIDYSSEEIKSFLMHEGLYQDLSKDFKNVKYFSVASFNFKDSIHIGNESLEDAGKLRFECSPSRMELPFIWMLNQFGVIK